MMLFYTTMWSLMLTLLFLAVHRLLIIAIFGMSLWLCLRQCIVFLCSKFFWYKFPAAAI